ncbi:MAG: Lrp/AsnC family transcriptional regulator [Candidatus Eremiobacterota bacterium]
METLTEKDKDIIRETQRGIPLCSRPFLKIAEKAEITEDELINRLRTFKEKGIIRRFGARIKHNKAGYKENIMVLWHVPEEKLEETGSLIAGYREISHCYIRPELPDLPYNLYSMIHGREEGDVLKVIEKISGVTGIKDYKLLVTEKEYKKTTPLYFL